MVTSTDDTRENIILYGKINCAHRISIYKRDYAKSANKYKHWTYGCAQKRMLDTTEKHLEKIIKTSSDYKLTKSFGCVHIYKY